MLEAECQKITFETIQYAIKTVENAKPLNRKNRRLRKFGKKLKKRS